MKAMSTLLLSAAGLMLAGGGYWLGQQQAAPALHAPQAADAGPRILYYRNPMGLPDTSPVPKKDPMGMDYLPVFEQEPAAEPAGRILYYRNPMGLPDTSPVPKKDPMGMDYIPVYASEVTGPNQVRVSADKVQKLGVRTERVQERDFSRNLRAVATLEPDEGALFSVAPRFEGWVERLLVKETGLRVEAGQPLFEVYSPELYAAAQEYRLAHRGLQRLAGGDEALRRGLAQLADSSLRRLQLWQLPEAELARLRGGGEPRRTIAYPAPRGGTVLAKPVLEGARFMPGEELFRLADLSRLWLQVEIPEQELALAEPGRPVSIGLEAYPGETFDGRVAFVAPVLNGDTRTLRVRVELDNPGGRLKPGQFAWVQLHHDLGRGVALPDSAVIDSGRRRVAIVALAEGLYEPRELTTAGRHDGYWRVTAGVAPGERVVTSANFLIDAESNLMAALQGMNGGAGPGEAGDGREHDGHAGHGAAAMEQDAGHGHGEHGATAMAQDAGHGHAGHGAAAVVPDAGHDHGGHGEQAHAAQGGH
ncbi:efflux RND transporter periplasmic adaptor subunit [Zobellella sp. An-6]|uniref:efflux RND transporter periplasmic adaptor subunit n=1 Tax=Zobellella sp. An-6 TaxID=3400218 RepID=UPI0040422127